MAVTAAAIAAKEKGGGHFHRVGAYIKAHWKELLALALAAIPALFIIMNWGSSRKTAQGIVTLQPDSSSGSGAAASTTIPSPGTPSSPPSTTPPFMPPVPPAPSQAPPGRRGGGLIGWLGTPGNFLPGPSILQVPPVNPGIKTPGGGTGLNVPMPSLSSATGAPALARITPTPPSPAPAGPNGRAGKPSGWFTLGRSRVNPASPATPAGR